jgi:hypothetical protein
MISKTRHEYEGLLAESFMTNPEAIELVVSDISGQDSTDIQISALEATAELMSSDPGTCVLLMKLNLLSNLVLSVL